MVKRLKAMQRKIDNLGIASYGVSQKMGKNAGFNLLKRDYRNIITMTTHTFFKYKTPPKDIRP